ncbi:condensation domain-containing protein, partial [Azomonas macrocytogenes]
MNTKNALGLAHRFIELPLEKRKLFLEGLSREKLDFRVFPIPAGVIVPEREMLSYAQQRMWFLWQLDPESAAYNLPGAVRLYGRLNVAALEQAFAALVTRHETLRSTFHLRDEQPIRVIHEQIILELVQQDLRELSEVERTVQARLLSEAEAMRPFDLEHGPLLRLKLLRLAEQEHVLLVTLHHIVSDGWSMGVLIDEFSRLYQAYSEGRTAALAELPIQYSDYALWQRQWLEAGEMQRQLDYWTAHVGDEHPVLALPTDHARPPQPSYRGMRLEFSIDPVLAEQLRSLAQQQGITLFMLLLASFMLLLQRYTGQNDIRVGVPIANRNRAETEGLIGFFVNTQVLRCEFDGQMRFDELLQQVRQAALGAQAHQELPFEQLVEALQVERNLSYNPLFQALYNHQSMVADVEALTTGELKLSRQEWEGRTTQFDLSLDTLEKSGRLEAALTYAVDLFERSTAERMIGHWQNLLRGIVTNPRQRLAELPLLGDAEREQILHEWNQTQASYPSEQCIQQLIEAQAARTPNATAVVFGEQHLSYDQLNRQANRLAHKLREQG